MKSKSLAGKVLEGTVISNKMQKTIVVLVVTKLFHEMYNRLIIKKKKYKVHDEEGKAKTGDRVRIVECRPYSKDKRFKLLEIVKC
jgi:small subunit ribosomal protein S17